MELEVPIPPPELRQRMSILADSDEDRRGYLERGAVTRRAIEGVLTPDWSWEGKRVLDFGCGSGRVLRHLLPEAQHAEFWGSDIDRGCIAWNEQHLTPPMSFVVNDEAPPLPLPAADFDLVYAMSVFTHITKHWSAWLLELHRVLALGGILVATFMGEGMSEAVAGTPWCEEHVGMNVYLAGQRWELGGPMVLHSPWWIAEHWGRLFDVEQLKPRDFIRQVTNGHVQDHGVVVLRKTRKTASTDELERIDTSDTREARALAYEVSRLRDEVADLRTDRDARAVSAPPPDPSPRGRRRRFRRD